MLDIKAVYHPKQILISSNLSQIRPEIVKGGPNSFFAYLLKLPHECA